MLKPAIIYKEEIMQRFRERAYTDDMLYYSGGLGFSPPEIDDDPDGSTFRYAIVDGGKAVGYLTYAVDWYASCAHCFGLISFGRNATVGIDVLRELRKIINEYHIHRLEWRMVGGNPVEKHYDRFCLRNGGRKLVLKDAIRDRHGRYHDDVIYEIIFGNRRGDTNEL